MVYHSSENKKCYFPPMLSNGEISLAPDAEGMLGYTFQDYLNKGVKGFDGIVVRAARRSAMCHNLLARLFPFGKFTFSIGSTLEDWSQTLETEKGIVESDCFYEDGTKIHSKGFIHPEFNIYALQKTFDNIKGNKSVYYDITLSGYNEKISEYMSVLYTEKRDDVCCIGFKMYGIEIFCGEIQVFVDKDFTMTSIDNGVRIVFDVSDGENVSFYYCLEDNMNGVDFSEVLRSYKEKIEISGFSGLLEECTTYFKEYYNLGYVRTSDEKLNEIYATSLYSIKCNTTKYSIAVGFNNGSWDGQYFAFDEYTSYHALLGANRLGLAKRVPEYRLNKCTDIAIRRASDCHRHADTEDMARYHWQSGELDIMELSPDGTWLDHIFHIPLVGIGAFEYYEYSGNIDFLRECYKMIRACAKFITKHMVYKDGECLYIGKCTDLERLGASVQNPFMTACGAIKLLQCCAKAAEVLRIDEEYAKECVYTAEKLYESLPVEGNMYTPFLHCQQKSIAVFAGKFPFDMLENDDEKMLNAWEDFEENGAAYGNMYPIGGSISPWYACWKAEGYARIKNTEKAYDSLKQAYKSAGVFGEMFEINEEKVSLRPWFATAAGIFVSSVNDMLLKSEGNVITILPAFPHSQDVSFKLAAKGGVTVEADVKDGELKKVLVLKDGIDVSEDFIIEF